MNFEVRSATLFDYDLLTDLWCEFTEFNYNSMPKEKQESYNLKRRLEKVKIRAKEDLNNSLKAEGPMILFAYNTSQPIGFAIITFPRERENYAYLNKLYIKKEYRANGIGSQLMKHIETSLLERGIQKVEVKAFCWNKTALDFYQSKDYEEHYISYQKILN